MPSEGHGDPLAAEHARAVRACTAVCAVALLVRLPFVVGNLPRIAHPDEPTNLTVISGMVDRRSLDPDYFNYPALLYVVSAGVLAAIDAVDGGGPLQQRQGLANARADRPRAVGALRLVGALAATLSAAAAGALAWSMRRRWTAAALAAALVAACPIDARYTALVTPEGVTAGATAVALVAAVAILGRPRVATYLLAGAGAGLAASAKYNAGAVAVAVVVAHAMAAGRPWRRPGLLVAAGAAAAAVFLAVNPQAILDTAEVLDAVRAVQDHYATGHAGFEGSPLRTNLRWLAAGLGPVLAAAVVPVARPNPGRRHAIVLAAFVASYVALVASYTTRFERNLVPVVAPLAALGAAGTGMVADAVRRRRDLHRPRAAAAALAVAVLAVPAVGTVRAWEHDVHHDPWTEAEAWFAANVPPGSSVAVEGYSFWVDPARWVVQATPILATGGDVAATADYLVLSSATYQRFLDDPGAHPGLAAAYRRLLAECVLHRSGDDTVTFTVRRATC